MVRLFNILFLYLLPVGAAYLVAPWLFYCWYLVMPKIPSIMTPLDLLFGSSRLISVYATLFSCWFIKSISTTCLRSFWKRIMVAMATWFFLLQIGFAFAVATNLETWQWSKNVSGLASDGFKDINTTFYLLTLPFNMLFSFWFLTLDITDGVYLTFRSPEINNILFFWVDILKIPWWFFMGWMISKVVSLLEAASEDGSKELLLPRERRKLILGWCGYLWIDIDPILWSCA